MDLEELRFKAIGVIESNTITEVERVGVNTGEIGTEVHEGDTVYVRGVLEEKGGKSWWVWRSGRASRVHENPLNLYLIRDLNEENVRWARATVKSGPNAKGEEKMWVHLDRRGKQSEFGHLPLDSVVYRTPKVSERLVDVLKHVRSVPTWEYGGKTQEHWINAIRELEASLVEAVREETGDESGTTEAS